MNKRTRNILDSVASVAFIFIIFIIYFEVSRRIAIYITSAVLIFLLITYIPKLQKKYTQIKYKKLLDQLNRYIFIREEEFLEKTPLSYNELHRELYLLSKIYHTKPMILFVNTMYIFVSEKMIEDIISELKKDDKYGEFTDMKNITANLIKKYSLKNKQELDAIISRLREKKLF